MKVRKRKIDGEGGMEYSDRATVREEERVREADMEREVDRGRDGWERRS